MKTQSCDLSILEWDAPIEIVIVNPLPLSSLTLKLELLFGQVYDLCNAARDGEDVGPQQIRDAVRELEAAVEEALAKAGSCAECGEAFPPLCLPCLEWEAEKCRDWCDERHEAFAVSVGVG